MTSQTVERLCVCYISALDLRRIKAATTPYISGLLQQYPWMRTRTIPEVDLEPTLFTGVYPHDHKMSQVQLKSGIDSTHRWNLVDGMPDILTTTAQCFAHLYTGSFDLAAVPPWRRRRFEIKKTRYMQRTVEAFLRLNGVETIFSIIGRDQCNYVYSRRFSELPFLPSKLFRRKYRFELLQLHSLDVFQHWRLDDPGRVEASYRTVDHFVQELHSRCQENGVTMMVLSDHGMEPVQGSIDLVRRVRRLGISREEFTFFIEAPKARYWFHTDRARGRILEVLSSLNHGKVLSCRDMHQYNVRFNDVRHGEVYFVADPGYVLFPHDYYHPLANLFLGLTDRQQRSRLLSPRYRGYHGYLPHHESEKGFMIVLDDRYGTSRGEADIIDVAPTLLWLLGVENRDSLKGTCVLVA